MAEIRKIAPPNLPLPPDEYDRQYFDQLNNALRLFFVAHSNATNAAIDKPTAGVVESMGYFLSN